MARRRMTNPWGAALTLMSDTLEAQHVMTLRLAKIARGGAAAEAESVRMVQEKMTAALQVQQKAWLSLMTGGAAGIPAATAATYRRKVRANRRRLLKGG